jgi:hypothetical protein
MKPVIDMPVFRYALNQHHQLPDKQEVSRQGLNS